MNIEEKAKAYDEALEQAKKELNTCGSLDCDAARQILRFFPELREKPLTPFQQYLNFVLRKVHFASIPGKMENTDKFILDTVKKHTDELIALAKKHEYTDCQLTEDERIRKWLVDYFSSIKETVWIHRDITCEQILEWLKKQEGNQYFVGYAKGYSEGQLNPKQKEQKPAEWSEEDEKMIDTIVSVLGQYIDYKAVSGTGSGYATPRYSKEIDWLKSLNPSWKPSNEQMEELERVVNGKALFKKDFIEKLYNDLKKLM